MDKDLKLLIQIWLSEKPHEETERLFQRLAEDEDFKIAFVDEVLMMGKIKAVNSADPKFSLLEEVLSDQTEMQIDFEEQIFQTLEKEDRRTKSVRLWLAVAALLLIGFLIFKPKPESFEKVAKKQTEEVKPEPLAFISSQQNAKWADDKYQFRKEIFTEEVSLLKGTARIDFVFGASLIISEGTRFTINDADEIFLHEGRLTCEVNEYGQGFIIKTDESEIVDLGTAFQVEAGNGVPTKVHVIDGEVKVKPIKSNESKNFFERQSVSVTAEKMENLEFTQVSIPTLDEYENNLEEERLRRYEEWQAYNRKLGASQDTLFHMVKSSRPIRTSRRDVKGSETRALHVFGCDIGRGRWLENGALDYDDRYDRTMVRLGEEKSSFTFMAWIKVDELIKANNALLCFEMPGRWFRNVHGNNFKGNFKHFKPGGFHAMRWQVSKKGNVDLNIAYFGKTPTPGALKWYRYSDPGLVTPDKFGQWICVAVSVDFERGQVRQFFNGEMTQVHKIKHQTPMKLEYLEIGNLTHPVKNVSDFPNFQFHGSFDEVFISGRPFGPKFMKELYLVGRP